jgi:hypothetical protein
MPVGCARAAKSLRKKALIQARFVKNILQGLKPTVIFWHLRHATPTPAQTPTQRVPRCPGTPVPRSCPDT